MQISIGIYYMLIAQDQKNALKMCEGVFQLSQFSIYTSHSLSNFYI